MIIRENLKLNQRKDNTKIQKLVLQNIKSFRDEVSVEI